MDWSHIVRLSNWWGVLCLVPYFSHCCRNVPHKNKLFKPVWARSWVVNLDLDQGSMVPWLLGCDRTQDQALATTGYVPPSCWTVHASLALALGQTAHAQPTSQPWRAGYPWSNSGVTRAQLSLAAGQTAHRLPSCADAHTQLKFHPNGTLYVYPPRLWNIFPMVLDHHWFRWFWENALV